MIFQHTIDKLLAGNKTQTRRVMKPNEVAIRGRYNKILAISINERDKWRVGQTYAVQPARGKSQVARIKIIAINSQCVHYINHHDAIAEGFANRHEFLETWATIHGADSLRTNVWILKFELVAIGVDRSSYPQLVKHIEFQSV